MIIANLPKNQKLLVAIGTVAVRHGQLEYALRMMIKSISGIGLDDAYDATEGKSSHELRRLIRKIGKQKLGEASGDYLRLEAFLTRSQRASQRRNELLHGMWATDLEGRELFRHRGRQWQKIPKPGELTKLADEMAKIADEMHDARLNGFLKDALSAAKELI